MISSSCTSHQGTKQQHENLKLLWSCKHFVQQEHYKRPQNTFWITTTANILKTLRNKPQYKYKAIKQIYKMTLLVHIISCCKKNY